MSRHKWAASLCGFKSEWKIKEWNVVVVVVDDVGMKKWFEWAEDQKWNGIGGRRRRRGQVESSTG